MYIPVAGLPIFTFKNSHSSNSWCVSFDNKYEYFVRSMETVLHKLYLRHWQTNYRHKICTNASIFRFVEGSDIKFNKKVNPFKVVVQMEYNLEESTVQENTNFIAGTNINFRLICLRVSFLTISKNICHIKF